MLQLNVTLPPGSVYVDLTMNNLDSFYLQKKKKKKEEVIICKETLFLNNAQNFADGRAYC